MRPIELTMTPPPTGSDICTMQINIRGYPTIELAMTLVEMDDFIIQIAEQAIGAATDILNNQVPQIH